MRGDDVGDVDLPIRRLAPHAAAGRAGIGVPLVFAVVGDVVDDQRLVGSAHCRARTPETSQHRSVAANNRTTFRSRVCDRHHRHLTDVFVCPPQQLGHGQILNQEESFDGLVYSISIVYTRGVSK